MMDLLIEQRRLLHRNPEVSENEYATQKRILEFLVKHSKAKLMSLADTGVLASFEATEQGPVILLRADTDALPIQETNTFEHKSTVAGVSHKCGHDGHTTILLGLAKHLSENPIASGAVHLLFQPAEENGMGAVSVLKDERFLQLNIDYVFALHNLPGFPMHQIIAKPNEFTSNVKSLIIRLEGKTAHAAEPEHGFNPAFAIANILHYVEANTKNEPKEDDFFLITPIHLNMGELAYGISAGYGEIHLTIRSWSVDLMHKKCEALENFVKETCAKYHLNPKMSWLEEFYSNINHPDAHAIIMNAAKKSALNTTEINTPFKWGEDFGLFTQKYKGAMFGLGAGEDTPALHNPDYDFPDELISSGMNMFYQIINEILEH